MTKRWPAALTLLLLVTLPLRALETKAYEVKKLAEGVYALEWTDPLADPIEANSLFVVNDEDVVVVDTSLLPDTARVLVSEIRKLTPKPVRMVINTHWHDDHILSNFVFRDAWPGVQFVAHANTRTDASEFAWGGIPRVKKEYGDLLGQLREGLRTGVAPMDGKPLDPARRKRWEEKLIPMLEAWLAATEEIRPMPPDVVVTDSLTIHRGARTIEVRHLGRGNTRGDVVVWLPQEKILATGDLVVNPVPFGFGSYYGEWVKTLDRLLEFPAETVFLSHGPVQKDKEYIRAVRGLLDALVTRTADEARKGSTLDEAKKNVTLADWRTRFAGTDESKQRAFDNFFIAPAVERAYLQAKGDPRGESPRVE